MVMHARKPQRLNDGYFEKHQSHPYQSSKYSSKNRDYEREASSRSTNYIRGSERDLSPSSNVPSGALNGSSYRSDSPDLDSPRDSRDRSDRYQSSSYIKIKDRGRSDYKKEKYIDKRDRRDRDAEHRTNHDRIEMSSSSRRSSKLMYQPSDKRSGSRERDRDHRDRGNGSNNNSSSDRISRLCDWSEHVSSSGKKYYYNCKTEISQWEKPNEWLDKEDRMLSKEQHREYRDKERDRDREDRFARSSYAKHSSSRNSRLRWPHDSDNVQSHRRRTEDSQDNMDISPGDSTPTSEASYSHSSTPNAQPQKIVDGPVLLANARLASHPSTPNNAQLSYTTSSSACAINTSSSSSSASKLNKNSESNSLHNSNLPTSSPSTALIHSANSTTSSNSNLSNNHSGQHNSASLSSSPSLPVTSSKKNHHADKSMGHSNDSAQHSGLNSSGLGDGNNQIANNNTSNSSNSIREHALHSPLYNLPHNLSALNHSSSGNGSNSTSGQYVQSSMMTPQSTGLGIGISSQFSAAGLKSDGSSTLNVGDGHGPPTPTQELDMTTDHRKLDGTSASLSSLQGVSSQMLRHQGPSLTPSLANYFRADLIAHVTNWPAEMLEKQAQLASDEANIIGNLQCTKVSADLKSARSVVRITEITATLQEQKVLYLQNQIRRLEELKSQNSFMSEDL
ncbi:WW domain-containing adapter protein with coiled-coil homolog isoform X2 [Contarinia nasturtii]|uniref:WW domain-containing adapter protein with coiled-coil homolog isoform X2 n=1 Tax=Contarinia nasturtii TaxID=265458 RepID=UPI0012D39BB2|nr:WW domain-containing adapter protein with coiled-coil homolog isoform X2 [Contarinia nasturtii]